jgi:hypothetical protein
MAPADEEGYSMARFTFMSIAVAVICAAGITVAAQSGDAKDKKKDDGAVTTAAKATGKKSAEVAKATAGGAKKLGVGVKNAVTPDSEKDKEKKKK